MTYPSLAGSHFDDVIFPQSIALARFKGKRGKLSSGTESQSGWSQRRSLRPITKRTWDAGMVTRPIADWHAIDDLYEIVDGQTYTWLIKDPTDYAVLKPQGLLALRSGLRYSFQKVITIGTHSVFRAIAKVDAATLTIYRTRAAVETQIASTDYTLTVDGDGFLTGDIDFPSTTIANVATDTFRWSGQFYCVARFTTDDLDWEVVDKQIGEGKLLVQGPSIPITEEIWPDLLYIPPT